MDGSSPPERKNEERLHVVRLSEGVALSVPPLYDVLSNVTEWPRFEDLAVDEALLTGAITTVTMAQLRFAVAHHQRGQHWSCYPTSFQARPTRSLLECVQGPNETPVMPAVRKRAFTTDASTRRKKRIALEPAAESDDASEKSSKQGRYRLNKVLAEWETMDFFKATPKQWKAIRWAAESHPGIRAKLEEVAVKKNWAVMIKKELPRAIKLRQTITKRQLQDAKRMADLCRREVRNDAAKNERESQKATQGIKKLVREMLTFYKRKDRQSADLKKQAEKAAAEQQKREEEEREKKRQAQRLNFLLSQTELYSHFMSKKLGLSSEPAAPSAEGEFL